MVINIQPDPMIRISDAFKSHIAEWRTIIEIDQIRIINQMNKVNDYCTKLAGLVKNAAFQSKKDLDRLNKGFFHYNNIVLN